jgi:hypothetical protein
MSRLLLLFPAIFCFGLTATGAPTSDLFKQFGGFDDDLFKNFGRGFPDDSVIVKKDKNPKTGAITTTASRTEVTKCKNDKCRTCINGKCRNLSIKEVKFPEFPAITFPNITFPKFPSIKDFGKFPDIGKFKGKNGEMVDVRTEPDGTKVITRSLSHKKIQRCENGKCTTCVDDECTESDEQGLQDLGDIFNMQSCAFGEKCKDGYECNKFFLICDKKGSNSGLSSFFSRPRLGPLKVKPSTTKSSERESSPAKCKKSEDCKSGYKCRSGYCLPTEKKIQSQQ